MTCPICDGPLDPLLHRARVPVHQNLPLPTAEAARAIPRGDLDLQVCRRCGFVTNVAFDPALCVYGEGYDNRQDLSPAFARHLDGRIEAVAPHLPPGGLVAEIGCGNARFLLRLCARTGARGVGFDPAYTGPAHPGPGVTVRAEPFGAATRLPDADVVLSRHVVEHLPNPRAMLRDVAAGMAPGTPLFLETPDVAWIARHGVTWDLFYEHCSLFTGTAARIALLRSGFAVRAVERVFGGQYLWIDAIRTDRPPDPASIPPEPLDVSRLRAEPAWIARWRDATRRWQDDGGVVAWGAGAKGVTFAHLIDPEGTILHAVVDINAGKAGRFVPGTGHPIVAPERLVGQAVRHVVVPNPRYVAEIGRRCAALGLDVVLHTQETE